jgi:predicted adenylyl cyclase CyaB
MRYEIELKAWVEDWAALETRLRATCEFVREFRKSDRYFRSPAGAERDTSFRLRRDNGAAVVTFKEKRPRDGIEYNLEREFSVDDAETFLELVERIDCTEYASKIKTGLEFRSDGMTIELVRVDGLGSFLEIEIIEHTSDTVAHERAAMKIRTFLRTTGIDEDRIEARSYVDLLRGEKIGKDGTRTR